MSINSVTISGHLTRSADLKATKGGTAISNFAIAVNERVKNAQTGQWEDYANFVDCVLFGARAEALNQYLTKGTKVFVNGHLKYSSWEKDGSRKSRLQVIVDNIDIASTRRSESPQPAQAQYEPIELADEDMPF